MDYFNILPDQVNRFHDRSDVDELPESQHHTLGKLGNQASPGNHSHDGVSSDLLSRYLIKTGVSVTGSRGGNAALASLLTQLEALGVITDNTTA